MCIRDRYRYLCVVALAEDLGAQALKSSAQTKAPSNKSRAKARRVPRKTGDGACGDSASGTLGVEGICSDGKHEVFSLFKARRSSS